MRHLVLAIVIAVARGSLAVAEAGDAGFQLTQTIPLPGVEGRIDHFTLDTAGDTLFVCALDNNSVEVIDLRRGERIRSITGLGSPQGRWAGHGSFGMLIPTRIFKVCDSIANL